MSQHVPTALLVEDHPLMGQMTDRFLRAKGEVALWAIATTAEEALAKLAAASGPEAGGTVGGLPDLVLVDLSLGTTSGMALLDELGRRYPELPSIVVSGHRDQVYVRQALDKGARGYVLKGKPEVLLEAIRRVLRGEIYVCEDVRNDRGENR